MTRFHTDALEAAHTQRELDEIPQGATVGPDAAKIALMEDLNWKSASQYWREQSEAKQARIEQLERELAEMCDAYRSQADFSDQIEKQIAAEKALADELEKVAHGVSWDHPARTAYRKARGL